MVMPNVQPNNLHMFSADKINSRNYIIRHSRPNKCMRELSWMGDGGMSANLICMPFDFH